MNAPMVFRDGKLWGAFGTPGADNQVQVNLQILVGMADFGLDPQQAVEAPRWTSSQPGQAANYPHGGDAVLTMEAGLAAAAPGLEALGHRVKLVPPLEGPAAWPPSGCWRTGCGRRAAIRGGMAGRGPIRC
ncbi:gamma-glutamyltransferase [Paeniroseomonas aquatica]|uniref:gamma-glutamyltransferase n=1 Tax=Paeniroseomonas aquatica TaxID=373043 RepID=UPI00361323A5